MRHLRQLFSRAREADPRRFDAVLTGVLLAGAMVEIVLLHANGANRWASIPVTLIALVPLYWRRTHTLEACIAFGVAFGLNVLLDTLFMDSMTSPFLAVGILFYSLGRYTDGWRTWAGVLVIYLPTSTGLALTNTEQPFVLAMLWSVALLAPPLVAGRIMRKRLEMQAELRDLTARLESDRGRREQRAIDSERGRIAEELQTLVANNVSAMVVQAGVVRPALAIPAPTTADTALATIEESGRDALVEMRRLLGVLRRDDAVAELAPQPSLDQALSLVERTRAEGLPVHLHVDGEPSPLARGVDLAAYRVLQETLDSARQAEGSRKAQVLLAYGDREVTVAVAVRDDGRGQRLLGEDSLSALRERVGLYGGTLRAGRLKDDHGFRVSARLPLEADA
ncbi:MAG TPA: histidine kinase [Thermoleophilaceae bacterium]|nr:histidine kinase [Thermoleophilaceae bacterium]